MNFSLTCCLAIGFLPGKDANTYIEFFSQLQLSLEDEVESVSGPKLVLLDQETAAHNALQHVFPEWRIRSCHFHFSKNVIDYAKNHGLATELVDDEFAKWLNEVIGKLNFVIYSIQ